MTHRILIVDDERNIRTALRFVLEGEDYEVLDVPDAESALEIIGRDPVHLILLDLKMKGMGGMDCLRLLHERFPGQSGPLVIVISGQATTAEAMETVKMGAFDFLEKPLDRSRVLVTIKNALQHRQLLNEHENLVGELAERYKMIGQSRLMMELYRQIEKIAPTKGRILILGESGTGKELVARAIHEHSLLARKPFVKVNCAAIPPELIESELFGHEKGAFTGAVNRKIGLFEAASGGTIFLDEIGDMSHSAQAKVLRVLQSGELQRVGGETTLIVDVRVIAATHRDLELMVRENAFREDLYFRLSVLPILLPPLRDRTEDIPLLVKGFISSFCKEYGFREKSVDSKVLQILSEHQWPGNVRELKNQVERMVILSGDHIGVKDLPFDYVKKGPPDFDLKSFSHMSLREFKNETEKAFIQMKLDEMDWNISRAADILGLERTNLHKKIKQYELTRKEP